LIELLVNLTISHSFKGYGSLSLFVEFIAIEMNNEKRNVVKRAYFELFFFACKICLLWVYVFMQTTIPESCMKTFKKTLTAFLIKELRMILSLFGKLMVYLAVFSYLNIIELNPQIQVSNEVLILSGLGVYLLSF
jgi:hypothetical protein